MRADLNRVVRWSQRGYGAVFAVLLLLAWMLLPDAAAAQGVTHTVQRGESLGAIAQYYHTTVDAIVSANGLAKPDFVWAGQKLVIPVASTTAGSDPGTAPTGRTYVVRLGDSLISIAQNAGITTADLISANGISDPDMLWVGQKLVIPGGGTDPDATWAPPPSQVRYTVRPGETLGQIAARYQTTAAVIARANYLTSPDRIYVGMQLIVPAPETTIVGYQGQPSRFVVSISQQRCWLYSGDLIVADWRCSTGQPGAATNPGSYAIQSKMERAYGSTWNIWMPYWLGIYWAGASENGIHGIPYNANAGWRLWEGYVGTPVTFGCILLDDAHAKQLYDLAYIGMPVIVHP